MSETLLTQRLADTLKRIRAARSCDQIRAMDIAVIEDAITALQSNTSRSQTETTEGLTPRTDALKARIEAESKGLPYETILHKLVGALSVHSRQLERELAIDAHELDERRRFMGTDLQDVYDRAEQAEAKLAEALREKEPTLEMLCEMAHQLDMYPRGDSVPIQVLRVLREQFVAAHKAARTQTGGAE